MSFDRKNLFLVFLWIIISIIEKLTVNWNAITITSLNSISWVIVLNYIFQSITWKIAKRDFVSHFFAFVSFFYIFHFGQVVVTGLLPDYKLDYLNYVTTYMDSPNLGPTIELCVFCINYFFIGGLLFKYKTSRQDYIPRRNVGRKLFWLLFPLKICFDLITLLVALTLGYNGVNMVVNSIPGVFVCFADLWYCTIPIYYLSLVQDGQAKKARNLIVWTIAYMCVTMLSGGRGHQTVAIISMLIVVYVCQNKINYKQLIKYGVCGIAGLFFIDIVYAFRETSISDFLGNMSSFTESKEGSNIFIETIGTFGETIFTPFLVIEGYGKNFHPFFGEAFVKSIAGIIPDVTGMLKDINNDAIFARRLGTKNAIGGSFAAELYYNFGSLYPLMSFLIGAVYSSLSNKINIQIRQKHYSSVMFTIALCGLSIWWVRDTIGNLTRQVCWIYLLIYFFGGFKPIIKRHLSSKCRSHCNEKSISSVYH